MSRREETTIPANAEVRPGVVRAMILGAAETLFPGYFALTMATGVVSIACALLGMRQIAWTLLVVNWIIYPRSGGSPLCGWWLFRVSSRATSPTISARPDSSPSWPGPVSLERRIWSSPRPGPSLC